MIAAGFVDAGCKVSITSRDAAAAEQVAREMSESGSCIALNADWPALTLRSPWPISTSPVSNASIFW